MSDKTPHEWMQEALDLALQAAKLDEVPVGAIVVKNGKVIGRGHNARESTNDPTAHAEMIAIREAAKNLGSWRLIDCDLYVTLEPCLMCAGAIYQSRIQKLIYGAKDPKGGAVGSLYEIHLDERLNHQFNVTQGPLENECSHALKTFFQYKRKAKSRQS